MTKLVAVLAVAVVVGSCASAADAAYFIAQPATYVTSGAGPFEWQFRSSTPGTSTGSMAYRLSTETVWHRCAKDYPARLSDLAEGAYSVTIADDIDLDWYSARGLLYSSFTQPCWDNPTSYAPQTTPTTAMLYVDATAPAVSEPAVITAGLDSLVSIQASDAVAGVASIQWSAGDGYIASGTTYVRHTYLLAGTWHGSVTVTDHAGNQTTRAYAVVVAPASSTPPQTRPAPPAADTTAPQLRVSASARQRLRSRGAALVTVTCSEPCTASATARLTASGHRFDLPSTTASLAAGQRRVLRLALTSRARQRSRAHTPIIGTRARASACVARDRAGNRAERTVRIAGV